MHETLAAKQAERESQKKIHDTAESLRDPAFMGRNAREAASGRKRGYSVYRAYDYEDMGVLFSVLHLLEAGGRVRVKNIASTAVFADHELPRISRLGRSLLQQRLNGWLEGEFERNDAYYVYGERVREIAKRWGITLRENLNPLEDLVRARRDRVRVL